MVLEFNPQSLGPVHLNKTSWIWNMWQRTAIHKLQTRKQKAGWDPPRTKSDFQRLTSSDLLLLCKPHCIVSTTSLNHGTSWQAIIWNVSLWGCHRLSHGKQRTFSREREATDCLCNYERTLSGWCSQSDAGWSHDGWPPAVQQRKELAAIQLNKKARSLKTKGQGCSSSVRPKSWKLLGGQ